ncbi:hypothetical protein ACOMHN_064104 [Nucella lapillus]
MTSMQNSSLASLINDWNKSFPLTRMDVTIMMLVRKAKQQNTKCVPFPNRAFITCKKVLAPGALVLN